LTNFPSRRAEQRRHPFGLGRYDPGDACDRDVRRPAGRRGGIYLEEYAPKNWVTDIIEINVTNLAGVPSIVYGLLALGLFVYKFGFGQSMLSAGLTLALLILPVVIVATREAIRAIPQMASARAPTPAAPRRWQTVKDHILPYSSAGILTGMIIGMARAIGETAPIITIGALTFIAFLPPADWRRSRALHPSTGCSHRSR
jgi:phosphate transport system permease protein